MPFRLLRTLAGVNPIIINYHMVSDKPLPYIINLYNYRSIDTFTDDLDFFTRYFHVIGLRELLDGIVNKTKLPENSLMITFDDGFREIYEIVAPILIERKITCTVFITKNFLDNIELGYDNRKSVIIDAILNLKHNNLKDEIFNLLQNNNSNIKNDLISSIKNISYARRNLVDTIGKLLDIDFEGFVKSQQPYLTSRHITELVNEGFTFGGHGIDHPKYAELSLEDQILQTITSVAFITEKFALDYRVFAFPYSDIAVSGSFFHAISDKIDATFGTEGLRKDCIDNNFQRISVEKFRYPAMRTVKFYYLRKLAHKITCKDLMRR